MIVLEDDVTAFWNVNSTITNYQSAGNIYYVTNGTEYTFDKVRFWIRNDITTSTLTEVFLLMFMSGSKGL